MTEQQPRIRIDKWLWVARFYKSRSLAQKAVTTGSVHLNSHRVKPSRAVRIGDVIQVRRGDDTMNVVVKQMSLRRGCAASVQELYNETEASVEQRKDRLEQRRLERAGLQTARVNREQLDRRAIRRFKQEMNDV